MISQLNGTVIRRSSPAKFASGKQIIYRFNGDPKYDETVADSAGIVPFCKAGELFTRNGKQWRVAVMRIELNVAGSRAAVPVHHIFLTDNF